MSVCLFRSSSVVMSIATSCVSASCRRACANASVDDAILQPSTKVTAEGLAWEAGTRTDPLVHLWQCQQGTNTHFSVAAAYRLLSFRLAPNCTGTKWRKQASSGRVRGINAALCTTTQWSGAPPDTDGCGRGRFRKMWTGPQPLTHHQPSVPPDCHPERTHHPSQPTDSFVGHLSLPFATPR